MPKNNGNVAKKNACAVIYSGGKDSHLALIAAARSGTRIACLITIDGGSRHPSLFNDLLKLPMIKLHARLMGLPLFVLKAPSDFDLEVGPAEMARIFSAAAARYPFDTVYCGTSFHDEGSNSADMRRSARAAGFRMLTPFSRQDVYAKIKQSAREGLDVLIVGMEKRLDPRWLGSRMDASFADYLRREAMSGNPADGNDFQTLVLGSPLMKKSVRVSRVSRLSNRHSRFLRVDAFTAARPEAPRG